MPLEALLGLALALGPQAPPPTAPAARPRGSDAIEALVEADCVSCHEGPGSAAGLDLEGWLAGPDPQADSATLRRLRRVLSEQLMPPPDRARPAPALLEESSSWIEAGLRRALERPAEPRAVPMRRLNAAEYQASVLDLFGVEFDAREHFPADGVAEGFDTVGDAQTLSEAQLEKLLLAAERIASDALRGPLGPQVPRVRSELASMQGRDEYRRDWGWALFSNGEVHMRHDVARAGDHILRVEAWGKQAGPEPARMELRVDGVAVGTLDVLGTRSDPEVHQLRVPLTTGTHHLGAAFVNDFYDPEAEDPGQRDRNLSVHWIEVEGPLGSATPSPFQLRYLSDEAAAEPRAALADLTRRVWRRPADAGDVERLLALSADDAAWPERLRLALVALLCSPNFLVRAELELGARELDGYELATRLAAFLWSSTPDDSLLEAAEMGELADAAALDRELTRMLRDPRASALARRFAVQWLQIEGLEESRPDARLFPQFDDELRAAMRAETELFFEAVLREGRPVRELLAADFTFVNERLARHYGLAGVQGEHMRRVRLDEAQRQVRGGLLGQASVLTATSTPTRTSPVKRGKFVLEALLGSPPPPPPPGNDSFDESPQAVAGASLRERLESHRSLAACAVCHQRMDPLGFALEGFDAVGALRTESSGFPIDDLGTLEDGRQVRGVAGLRSLLVDDSAFVRTLASKLMTFALGRALDETDQLQLDRLSIELDGREATLVDLVRAVVLSPSFRRTGPGGESQ